MKHLLHCCLLVALTVTICLAALPARAQSDVIIPPAPLYWPYSGSLGSLPTQIDTWPDPFHDLLDPDNPVINSASSVCSALPGMTCCYGLPSPVCFPIFVPPPPCDCSCLCSLCHQFITYGYIALMHEVLREFFFGSADVPGNPDTDLPAYVGGSTGTGVFTGGPSDPALYAGSTLSDALGGAGSLLPMGSISSLLDAPSRLGMDQSFMTGTIFIGKAFEPTSGDPKDWPALYGIDLYHQTKEIGLPIAGTYCDLQIRPPAATPDCPAPHGPTGVGLLKPLMWMAEEMTRVMMHHTFIVGTFFDASIQLETQLLFQDLTASVHKTYQPEIEMCVIGSGTRSLASAAYKGRHVNAMMAQRALDRELGSTQTSSAEGGFAADRANRLKLFTGRYCNFADNNPAMSPGGNIHPDTGLGLLCEASPTAKSMNLDVDFYRSILHPPSLDVALDSGAATDGDIDVLAMANNLYAHDLMAQPTEAMLKIAKNRDEYLSLRSVVAKRSVAETSFNTLVGMKAAGDGETALTAEHMRKILEAVGVPTAEIPIIIDTPGYLAQMEYLAKTIYQRPDFYTNLYTSPANVQRRSVAMQAIGMMLERDIYESHIRSEAILSILLEMKLIPQEDEVLNVFYGLQGHTRQP